MVALPTTIAGGVPPQGGGRADDSHANNSDRPQELLQEVKLVVQDANGTVEILLKGQVTIVHSRGPQSSSGGDDDAAAAGQGGDTTTTATAGRQAAANGDSGEEELEIIRVDAGDLESIRGWLMAAATLFVGIAYEAATQPPAWMPSAKDALDVLGWGNHAPATSSSVTKELAQRTMVHLSLNTCSLGISLTLVALLPMMNKATPVRTWKTVIGMVMVLTATVAASFCNGISEDQTVGLVVILVLATYASVTATVFMSGVLPRRNILISTICNLSLLGWRRRRAPSQNQPPEDTTHHSPLLASLPTHVL